MRMRMRMFIVVVVRVRGVVRERDAGFSSQDVDADVRFVR